MGPLSIRKPSEAVLRQFLERQAKLDFSYPQVGASADEPPRGYVVDRTRMALGQGEQVFDNARRALQRWEQFQLGWVEVWPPHLPILANEVVAVLGWAVGFWWVNACRIIYVLDESGPRSRFGFAYGTLPGHVAIGEERFLIEWDRETDCVWYDVLAFSRPNHLLTRMGYPLVRRNQKRFGRDSSAATYRAVGGEYPLPEVSQSTC